MYKFLAVLVAVGLAQNIMLQKPIESTFVQIFQKIVDIEYIKGEESDFGRELFLELQAKVKAGASLKDVNEHLEDLKKRLSADQQNDEESFEADSKDRVEKYAEIEAETQSLLDSKNVQTAKLKVILEQSDLIDRIFERDSELYLQRLGTQNAMLDTIQLLTDKINQNLVEGSSFIQKSDLFEKLKALGRGKHVEALAQLTAHLDQDQVTKVLALLGDLNNAIEQSIAADEAKEQENIKLYQALKKQIEELLEQTNGTLARINDLWEEKDAARQTAKLSVDQYETHFEDRSSNRGLALQKTIEAQELLLANADKLIRWEGLKTD